MIRRWILTVFVCFFNDILSMPHGGISKQDSSRHKLNVVLFFANSCKIPKENSAAKCLGMQEITRVKHSIPVFFNDQTYIGGIMQRNTPDCNELLKEGLSSLTHFCQNALGMKTAIVSVSAQSITRDLNEDQESMSDIKDRQIPSPDNYLRNDLLPKPDNQDTIPSFSKSNVPNFKEVKTNPLHTEIFNIRVKRHADEATEKPGEIVSIPLEKQASGIPWDVLNFMEQIRYSFFGKLLEDEAKSKLAEEENRIPGEISITNEDPGLFETVKSTLTSLQEAPGKEFLMIVFGGHLSEMSNNHSPLIQSVKHVIESTDPENTLIVLTGTCADQKGRDENVVTIDEGSTNQRSGSLPVFAKGPKCEELKDCLELQDIPLTVKSILEETSPNFGEAIISARERRSLFSGMPINRRSYANHAVPISVENKFYSLLFYLCASILFIL